MLYRVQITYHCFHLVDGTDTLVTLCGENLVGRSVRPTSTTICEKCKVACLSHRNARVPRVRILPPGEGILRKCGMVEGDVEYIMRIRDHWMLGINTHRQKKVTGHYRIGSDGKQEQLYERVYPASDECAWTDEEVEVVEGDLDWYGTICEGLHTAKALPDA